MIIIYALFFIVVVAVFVIVALSMNKKTECICVFDLDNTLTCGIDRASNAISACKNNNCRIAINTARPEKWYNDIELDKLGLKKEDFDSDFYVGEPFKCSFSNRIHIDNHISDVKVKHLHTLSDKWNVDPKRIILFDDMQTNVEKAKNSGFTVVHANHSECGIPDNIESVLRGINA